MANGQDVLPEGHEGMHEGPVSVPGLHEAVGHIAKDLAEHIAQVVDSRICAGACMDTQIVLEQSRERLLNSLDSIEGEYRDQRSIADQSQGIGDKGKTVAGNEAYDRMFNDIRSELHLIVTLAKGTAR